MSQEKVDKYKQEKYNRKHATKKRNMKKIAAYVVTTLVAIIFIGYMGYSIAVTTGLYTPATTTSHTELSKSQLESIRNALVQKGDSNVKGTAVLHRLLLQQLQNRLLLNKQLVDNY